MYMKPTVTFWSKGSPVRPLKRRSFRSSAGRAGGLVDVELDRRVRVLLRPVDERLVDLLLGRAVEDRRGNRGRAVLLAVLREDAVRGRPAEMRLEHLADVHAARHAKRVQDDVDRVPSSRNGMSSSATMRAMTPLLPWRPASLSPSAILRFFAT